MKYMGSKNRIADDILSVMLENYSGGSFVDAFCGGCSVIQRVPDTFRRIANDKNRYLIAMWKALLDGERLPIFISREFYSDVRSDTRLDGDKYSDGIRGWVGFMGSFNGRFFDGGYSGHAVEGKNGSVRDYISENINNTLSQVEQLKGVEFVCGDYSEMDIPDNSLIYCDPPYKGTKQYTTSKNFDYGRFYEWIHEMKDKGHTVFVSEYQMPDDFTCVWEKGVTNAMNQTITKKTVEKLFVPV